MENTTEIPSNQQDFQTDKVATMVGGHFTHDFFSAFLAPLLPRIQQLLSLTLAEVGALSAFVQYPALINPVLGYFADRVNLKYLVILAPAITGTAMSLMGYTSTYFALAMLLLIAGFSSAFFHAPSPPMVSKLSGKTIGRGMGLYMAAGEMGRTIGPIVATWVVSEFTFKGLLPIAAFGWIASALLFWRLKDVTKPLSETKASHFRDILPKLSRILLPIVAFVFFRNFLTVSLTTFLPTFMNEKGASLVEAGVMLSILEVAGVAGVLLSGTISDKIGRKRVLVICIIGSSASLLIFLLTDQQFLVPNLLILGFFALSSNPVLLSIVQENFPNNRALANGMFMFSTFLIRPFQSIILGSLGDHFGGLEPVYMISVFAALLAIPTLLLLPKTLKNGLMVNETHIVADE